MPIDTSPIQRARLCPRCGGSAVDFSSLAGGTATCRCCSWTGVVEELVNVPFNHMFGGDDGIAQILHRDLRVLISGVEVGPRLLRFLVTWGFVPVIEGKPDVRVATRYLAAVGRGILESIFKEREKIEKEKHGGD